MSELPDNIPPEYLDYIEDELTPAQAMAFEAKLAADPVLRDSLDALRVDRMLLRELPQVSAPATLTRRLELGIQRQHSPWRTYRPALAAGLALCCIGLGVLMVANFWSAQPPAEGLALNTGKTAADAGDKRSEAIGFSTIATTDLPTAKDWDLAILQKNNVPAVTPPAPDRGDVAARDAGGKGRTDDGLSAHDKLAMAPRASDPIRLPSDKEGILTRSMDTKVGSLHDVIDGSAKNVNVPTTLAPTPAAPVIRPDTTVSAKSVLAVTQPAVTNMVLALVIQVHNDQQEQTALKALQQVQNTQTKNWRLEAAREKLASTASGSDATKAEAVKKLRENEDQVDLRLDSGQMETLVAALPDSIGLFVDTPMPESMDKASKVSGTGSNQANNVAGQEPELNGPKQVGQQNLGNTSQPQRMRINLRGVVLEQQGGNLSQQFQRNQQNLNGYFDNPRLTNGITAPRWMVRIERITDTEPKASRAQEPAKR